MDINIIRERCTDSLIEVTQHILMRCQQRKIFYGEIKEVIQNGEIIEEYPEDYPYPSCLIFGMTVNKRILHVVVGVGEEKLWLITAYEPDPTQWDSELKVRKE